MTNLKTQLEALHPIQYRGFNVKYRELHASIIEATPFLPADCKLPRRVWHILHETSSIPLCKQCNKNPCVWSKHSTSDNYSDVCSQSCRNKYGDFQKNAKQGMLDKYGVTNAMHMDGSLEKRFDTMTKRHGSIQNAYESQLQSRIKSNRETYGVDNVMHVPNIKQKHYDKIGSGLVESDIIDMYQKERLTASEIAIHFGVYRSTVDKILKKHKVKMFNKGKIDLNTLDVLNNPERIIELQKNHSWSIGELAKNLGLEQSTLYKRLQESDIKPLTFFVRSRQQEDLTNFVKGLLPDTAIISNTKQIIAPLELDIYIPEHKLAIEYCGLFWHSERHPRITPTYHLEKLKACQEKGIRLLTIFEDEWVEKKEIVESKIRTILNLNDNKVFARKTVIKEVSTRESRQFLNQYHIQGDGPGSIRIGLYHNDQLVACMIFIEQQNGNYILNRYATSCNVVGGFSKLLSYFKMNFKWNEIASFADLRWSEGNVYTKLGFVHEYDVNPDYYWLIDGQRQHKFNWRHGARLKTLPNYDAKLSETANMHLHGHTRVWNCGLMKFVMYNS